MGQICLSNRKLFKFSNKKKGEINYNFKFHMGIQFSTKILIATQNYECILARGGIKR